MVEPLGETGSRKKTAAKAKAGAVPRRAKKPVASPVEEAAKSQAIWASPATVESEKIQV